MQLFPYGHATHPQWPMAAALVLAQVRAQMALHGYASSPTLALLYITDHYAGHAQDILEHLQAELPSVTDWSGTATILLWRAYPNIFVMAERIISGIVTFMMRQAKMFIIGIARLSNQ